MTARVSAFQNRSPAKPFKTFQESPSSSPFLTISSGSRNQLPFFCSLFPGMHSDVFSGQFLCFSFSYSPPPVSALVLFALLISLIGDSKVTSFSPSPPSCGVQSRLRFLPSSPRPGVIYAPLSAITGGVTPQVPLNVVSLLGNRDS